MRREPPGLVGGLNAAIVPQSVNQWIVHIITKRHREGGEYLSQTLWNEAVQNNKNLQLFHCDFRNPIFS